MLSRQESILNRISALENDFTTVSPCRGCSREKIDKKGCMDICARLYAYRDGKDWRKELPVKLNSDNSNNLNLNLKEERVENIMLKIKEEFTKKFILKMENK